MPVKIFREKMYCPGPVIAARTRCLPLEDCRYRCGSIIIKKLPDRILVAVTEHRLDDGVGAVRLKLIL